MENNKRRWQENKALCEKMMTFFFGVLLSIAGDKGGIIVKALARHVAPGWYPGVDAICEMSLLLVLARPCFKSFPRLLLHVFSFLLNNQHFQIPIPSGMVYQEPLCACGTFQVLFLHFFIFFLILVILQWLHKTFVIILHFDK